MTKIANISIRGPILWAVLTNKGVSQSAQNGPICKFYNNRTKSYLKRNLFYKNANSFNWGPHNAGSFEQIGGV